MKSRQSEGIGTNGFWYYWLNVSVRTRILLYPSLCQARAETASDVLKSRLSTTPNIVLHLLVAI